MNVQYKLTELHLSMFPLMILSPSMTMRAAMMALVVAMAGIMLPAMAETTGRVKQRRG